MSPRAAGWTGALLGLAMLASCIPPSRRNPPPAQPPYGQPQPWGQPTYGPTPPYQPTATAPAPAAAPTPAPQPSTAQKPIFRLPGLILGGLLGGGRTPRPTPTATAAPPAPAPAPTGKGCGEVNVDGVTVPLDCVTRDYGRVAGAMRMPAPVPPKTVIEYLDHRVSQMEGPTRHQRRANSGAACALASVIDQGLIRNGGGFLPVSALHLWARSPAPTAGAVVGSLGKGVAAEATLPYDEGKACKWASAEGSVLCGNVKHEAPTASDVDATPFARLTLALELDGTSGEALRDALLRDHDVLFSLRVDPEAWKAVVKSAEAEPLVPDFTGTAAAHTVALAGFALQEGQWFYLIKNSWGPAWGRDGYAWVQETTLKRNVIAAYVVEVSVMNGATIGPAGPHACPPGQLPDATTRACAAACPNGSQPRGGACK
ncbi:MAG: hypothetical protein EOO75_05140 [Myxococcales bacterium]|nr:MAG: hypothetical protein EOO75_05140 [Myxococcales bacterium]